MLHKATIHSGFTLIELLVTISMAGILFGIAIPSFNTFVKDNRITTAVNEMITSFNLARSESIRRGVRVSMCKSSDGNSCATSGNWSQGWIIFTDPANPSAAVEPTFDSTTEVLLKVSGQRSSQLSITGNTDVQNYVSYLPNGQSSKINGAMQTGTLLFCDDRIGTVGKNIRVSNTGRTRIEKNVACGG